MQYRFLLALLLTGITFNHVYPLQVDSILTEDEIEWLSENKNNITFSSDPFWPPIDFLDEDGQPKGIVADYIKIFEEELDVDFKFIPYSSWNVLFDALKKSEIDFVGSVSKNVDRSEHLLFTESYLELPLVILVREDYPAITSKDHINKMKIAVVEGYSSMEYLQEHFPGADLIKLDNDLSALLQTSLGQTDGTIIDLASASYLIGKYKVNNLAIGINLDYTWNICFATSRKNPELISIFDKLLKNIHPDVKSEIYGKWININNTEDVFWEQNRELLISVLMLILGIVISIIIYNRKLKKEVVLKTTDLKREIDKKNEALKKARESEENYRNLFEYGAIPKWIYDIETYEIKRVNQTAIDHYGYTEEEFLNMTILDIRPKSEYKRLMDTNRSTTKVGAADYYGVWKHIKKNNEIIDVEVYGHLIEYEGRKSKSISCIDITQRLKDEQMLKDFAENLEKKVEIRTEELFAAHKILKEQHQQITDSINYAKKIQYAIFPKIKEFKNIFNPSFIFFRPKDVVSGDFYWCHQVEQYRFAVVADCTGHGVPGALLTMIGNQLLKQTLYLKEIYDPAQILMEINSEIKKLMRYESSYAKDGMDIAICRIDDKKNELSYSGARISLFYGNSKGITEIKGSKNSIGGGILDSGVESFNNHIVPIEEGNIIYLSTDGFFDQFGGLRDKKLSRKRFMNLLEEIKDRPLRVQCSKSVGYFKKWKGNREQTDDVLLVGIQF